MYNSLSKANKFVPSNYNILVVEDSKYINHTLTSTFEEMGYNCFSAFKIKDALNILEETEINYLLLDIHLPDGNGYELISKLENSDEKIFVLTSETNEDFRELSYTKGIIDFVLKDHHFFNKIHQINTTIEQLEKNKTKTILVVDDSTFIQKQLKSLLGNRNYNIELALDSTRALEVIHQRTIDLMILDIELKDSNGIEFLEEYNNEIINIKKIPVLIVSGKVEPETIRNGIKAGAVDLIKKPYVIEEIVLKVDLWIDYKRKSEEVIASTKLLQEHKDVVDEGFLVYKTDTSGIITYTNHAFCELTGYKKEELLGNECTIVRHSDTSNGTYVDIWNTIRDLKKTWKGRIKNKNKDGSYFWVDTLIKPIIDENACIVEYIALMIDVTEEEDIKEYFKIKLHGTKKDLHNSIKLSKEYEKAINESNILSKSDVNGKITYVNNKFVQISGYTKEECIGEKYDFTRHSDTPIEIFNELHKTLKNGKIYKGVIKNRTKKGNPYWVNTIIVPIKNDDDKIIEYMSIKHDLTELFNLHKEIEDTQKDVVYRMGEIGETRSQETGYHVKRVAEYSKVLALLSGLSISESEIIY